MEKNSQRAIVGHLSLGFHNYDKRFRYLRLLEPIAMMLSRGFGDGISQMQDAFLACELPLMLNRPVVDILAPVTRAIYQRKAVRMRYFSHSSGVLGAGNRAVCAGK